jgi:hypothetical protein
LKHNSCCINTRNKIGIEVNKDKTRIDVFEGLVTVRKRNSDQTVSVSPNFRAVIENNSSTIRVVEFKDIKTDETTGNRLSPVNPFSTEGGLKDSTPDRLYWFLTVVFTVIILKT